ncbi:flagellar protein FlaG [Psychrosphaera aquimarina]|uniref:Flagellar protein FlaG n=1 Tax=Psychrosphaera aquimarina TaxID=2044854 RepID=A0ABU3QZF4_9GAMM|nr:flagellar protein FlaG [Psychrosphaera aquimarina]MDU0112811.1 flagellar protein FlaG [Psychrosphaera aquimarina]
MSDLISNTGITNSVVSEIVNKKTEKLNNDDVQTNQSEVVKVESKQIDKTIAEAHTEKRLAVKELEDAEEQKAIEEVASKLQDFVNLIDKQLQFRVDDDSGRHVVTVSDKLSGDVIRQIPSEEVLRLARNLSDLADTANRSGKIIVTEV